MHSLPFADPSARLHVPFGARVKSLARIASQRCLPLRWALAAAGASARVKHRLSPRRARRLEGIYRPFLPPDAAEPDVRRCLALSRVVKHLGTISYAPVFRRSRNWLLRTFRPEGMDALEALRRAGKGAIVLATHAGPLAWVAPVLRQLGYPVWLMERHQIGVVTYLLLCWDKWVDHVLAHPTREGSGPHLKRLVDLLRQGAWIQHLGDFLEPKVGLTGNYLGCRVQYTRAPWIMARLAGVPVIPTLILMDSRYRLRLHFREPLYIGAGASAGHTIESGFQAYLDFVQERTAPAPWNVHAAYVDMVRGAEAPDDE